MKFARMVLISSSLLFNGLWATEQLPEYTVRAWHFENDTLSIPADVTRIERDAIERSLATSIPDLLEVEANLFFSTISGVTNVAMRGFGEGSGLRTLILVDGQPINPSDMGRIGWEQIPLNSIESIEVLRGGHNVLYGDQALAGVIKIETRQTGDEYLTVEGRIESFDTTQSSISGGFGSGEWGVSAGGFYRKSEGYRDNSDSRVRTGSVKLGRTFQNGDEVDVRLAAAKTELSYAGGLVYEDYKDDPTQSGNLGDEGSEDESALLTSRYEAQRQWGSFEILTGYTYRDIDWSFGSGSGSYGTNEQDGYSLKPRALWEGDRLNLTLGNDLHYDTLEFTEYIDEARTLVPGEADVSEGRISPYFLAEYALTDAVTLSGGARQEWVRYEVDYDAYDRRQLSPIIETNRGPRPNPFYTNPPDRLVDASYDEVIYEDGMAAELSVNFRASEQLSIWAGYDRVYRYPSFDERAAYQGFELAENVSTELEAEEGDNFELGLKFIRGEHELYATAYYLFMKNEIGFDPSATGSNPMIQGLNVNLGEVRRIGGDLAYHFKTEAWGASMSIAYVNTEMKSGEGRGHEVPLVPDVRVTSQVWYKPIETLRLRFVHRYVGEQYQGGDFTNSERKVDAYHLFDAQAELDISNQCSVFVKVDNIFDELYAEGAYAGLYYPGDGRSFGVGVKLNF